MMLDNPHFMPFPKLLTREIYLVHYLWYHRRFLWLKMLDVVILRRFREVGDMEIRNSYSNLCDNGVLREEYKIVEQNGLNCALDFPQKFKTKWIQIVSTHIHDNYISLEGGPIKIMKRIINWVLGYLTLDRPMGTQSDAKETIEKNISVMLNKRCLFIQLLFP